MKWKTYTIKNLQRAWFNCLPSLEPWHISVTIKDWLGQTTDTSTKRSKEIFALQSSIRNGPGVLWRHECYSTLVEKTYLYPNTHTVKRNIKNLKFCFASEDVVFSLCTCMWCILTPANTSLLLTFLAVIWRQGYVNWI